MRMAREQEDSFYYLWKHYLATNGKKQDGADMAKEVESRVNGVMGDDNNDRSAAAAAPEGAASAGDD